MRVNIHSHIFTLGTVLSTEAIRVITQRLRDRGVRDFIVDALEQLLVDLLDKPEHLDERELLARLFRKLSGIDDFGAFVGGLVSIPDVDLVLTGRNIENLPADALQSALDHVSSLILQEDGPGKSPMDIVQTLRVAMRSTITEVADTLLDQMDRDDAIVALMMDIHDPKDPPRDRDNFLRQVAGTAEAAVQRPGRVLPFFGVHPERVDHFELMDDAIQRRGFLGVKLYPSLGYEVDHPKLLAVYDYCLEHDVPVLLHCGHGGFYKKKDFIDYCDPSHWKPILVGDRADLRVCFAHFGGWQSLGTPEGLDPGTWGHTIHELMLERANVFTDLAYHTDQMKAPALEAHYFAKLADLLRDAHLQRRILFGTDSWLLRLDMSDTAYWTRFRNRMGDVDFDKIASLAPRSFLGFPEAPGAAMKANLRRYVDYMTSKRGSVGAEPAAWLAEAVGEAFKTDRDRAHWDWSRHAVKCTHQWFHAKMSGAQKAKGYPLHRTLRLEQLEYFRPRDPNFALICQGEARDFLAFSLKMQGAKGFRGKHDKNTAVADFNAMLMKGDKTLADVAAMLDARIAFAEPMS
jgi:predicted TIM-barrel fold metal-dependent hydrolase